MSPTPRHASSAVLVGDVTERTQKRAIFAVAVIFVVAIGRELLPEAVDTSTRSGWLIANSVWVLAVVAGVALVVDILRKSWRQVFLEVDASGVVLRTGTGPASTLPWTALTGVVLTSSHRASLYSRNARLRMILILREGAAAVVDPQFEQWRGRYGAHASDLGIPVLFDAQFRLLDSALQQFAGPLYHGVVDGGTTSSLSSFFG